MAFFASLVDTFLVVSGWRSRLKIPLGFSVTPDFLKKIKCISYVRQDQVDTHMIDVMSEISINNNKNVQELKPLHYLFITLRLRLEGLYNDQR
jgi:uncharacterized protein YbdZ (MbtH family)